MVRTARCFRGDRPALTAIRLRRIVSFLRRHRLFDTAHELERQTGALFDAAHFRRLLSAQRWADASSYALGFVNVGTSSHEADTLMVRILTLRVMCDLAAGRARAVDALFERLYASLDAQSDGHHLRRILLSMRSDRARASTLYHRIRPMAVDVILNLAAKCPELKAKAWLPRCTSDPAYVMSLGLGLWGYKGRNKSKVGHIPAHVLTRSFMQKRMRPRSSSAAGRMRPQSSPVVLLHLRRLDRFLRHQGLHSTAYMLEKDSMAYFDAAHLQKLVRDGQWNAAWRYVRSFSPLWELPEGEGTSQQYTDFVHSLQHNSMLHYVACRGKEGGRFARSLFLSSDVANKSPTTAQRHDLYRSMASEQARASVNWEAIKLATMEKLQELLCLSPDLECSFRMREAKHTPTPLEITPLALWGSQRHRKKRVDRKPAYELALFLLHKRPPSSQDTRHSCDSGRKHLRSQDDYCTGNTQQHYPIECFKRPRAAGDVGEWGLNSKGESHMVNC